MRTCHSNHVPPLKSVVLLLLTLTGTVFGQDQPTGYYLDRCRSLLQNDSLDLAAVYADSALLSANQYNSLDNRLTAYLALYEVHTRMNDHQKALGDFKMAVVYRDSILSMKLNSELDTLKVYLAREKEARHVEVSALNVEVTHLRQEAERDWLNMLPILGGLIILAGLAVFWIYREKRRLKTILEESENDLRQLRAFKDKLYTVLSYDLRSSLGAFENLTHGLSVELNSLDREETLQVLNKLHETAGDLKGTLNNVILWVALQANARPYAPMNFDCRILAEHILEKYRGQLTGKRLAADVFMPQGQEVHADREMVEIILENLLTNAIHFTPAAGSITIFSGSKDGLVTLGVKDTGVGIAAEDLAKLFKVETDNRSIGKLSNKGAGVGLILCKELVEKNGGRMYVESTAGEGSTFYFTLPEKKFG